MENQSTLLGFEDECKAIKVSQETLPNFQDMVNTLDEKSKRLIMADKEMVDVKDNEFTQYSLLK